VFIDSAAEVLKSFPQCKFQIIGSAMFGEEEYEAKVREQVHNLGLDTAVEFTGYCEDVYSRISNLDVLVHASTTGEPFGQVVIEGMVAGKPVVATSGGGILEIVEDGKTGHLVPMGDSNSMAKAICSLLADPDGAAAMGLNGRKRVLQHFTIEITANKVQEIYSELLG
jgi:glycosyltransferase involved in cell wall biosynthesis